MDTSVFNPVTLVRNFLGDLKPEQDLRYFVLRNIRKKYGRELSSQTVHFFQLLANTINTGDLFKKTHEAETEDDNLTPPYSSRLENAPEPAEAGGDEQESTRYCNYNKEFVPQMLDVLRDDPEWKKLPKDSIINQEVLDRSVGILELFVECCRDAGYLSAHKHRRGCLTLRTQIIDAEYLISRLFGLPTGIAGFDDLFGGGGLILPEDLEVTEGGTKRQARLNGRTILINGPFGSGKSLLSLQFAVEVARKGGISWLMPLEQTPEECLYTLEAMGVLPRDESVIVANTPRKVFEALRRSDDDRGALIIFKTLKSSYAGFLSAFVRSANRMKNYPLRLISVDPINSISGRTRQDSDLRDQVFKEIEKIKKLGTNVLLVGEESADPKDELLFEQNIADTVIHLSVNKHQHGNYAQRYFEIMKSRFQREQRGEHPFSIVPGRGVRIFPSTASVHARIYTRGFTLQPKPIDIGPLSRIYIPQEPEESTAGVESPAYVPVLQSKEVHAGDIIVFQGPSGSFKTPLGLFFLLGSEDTPSKPGNGKAHTNSSPEPIDANSVKTESSDDDEVGEKKSLFIATRDNQPTIKRMLLEFREKYKKVLNNREVKSIDDIKICSLRHGFVQPGYVLQMIRDEFIKADREGYAIDRVLVDNIAHWEMSCPFIRDDETFGITLLDFLRRHRVTSLVLCGEPSPDTRSVLQRSIIDNADCVLRFGRTDPPEKQRIQVRVIKSHSTEERHDNFELIRESAGVGFQIYPEKSAVSDG